MKNYQYTYVVAGSLLEVTVNYFLTGFGMVTQAVKKSFELEITKMGDTEHEK